MDLQNISREFFLLYLVFGDLISSKFTFASVGFQPKSFHLESLNCFTKNLTPLVHYSSACSIPRSVLVQPPSPGWCATQYLRMMRSFLISKLSLDCSCINAFNNKRIFILRGNSTKNVRDLSDVSLQSFLDFCIQNDIIPIDPSDYTFTQQVSIFSCVKAVIGVHGAAFTNQIFCSPNTKFSSLFLFPQLLFNLLPLSGFRNYLVMCPFTT